MTPDVKALVDRSKEVLARIEASPQRTIGGADGQTMEATYKATLKQISLWDLETLYEITSALETLSARIGVLEGALEDLVSWFPETPPRKPLWLIEAGEYGADDAVSAARAALSKETPHDT